LRRRYHKGQGLTMEDLGLSLENVQGQPLELLAREGARMILSVALEEEVTEFLGREGCERSHGESQGYSRQSQLRGSLHMQVVLERLYPAVPDIFMTAGRGKS